MAACGVCSTRCPFGPVSDTNGHSTFSNLQALSDFDMTQEELSRPTRSGIIHLDDLEQVHGHLAALLTTGDPREYQLRLRHKDGAYRWTLARDAPCRDAQGNLVRWVAVHVDVDDLRRAEDLLSAEVKLLERVARGESLSQVLQAFSRQMEGLFNGCFCGSLVVGSDKKHFELGAGPSLPREFNALLERRNIDGGGSDPYSRAFIEKTR